VREFDVAGRIVKNFSPLSFHRVPLHLHNSTIKMIEFQYFNRCPHAKDTLQNLRDVMTEKGIGEDELQIIIVLSPKAAQKIKFQGSPTILFNGVDIYTGVKPEGFSYSCRVYEFDGRQTGVIPREFIREKLEEFE
jgi:hypothetical protein